MTLSSPEWLGLIRNMKLPTIGCNASLIWCAKMKERRAQNALILLVAITAPQTFEQGAINEHAAAILGCLPYKNMEAVWKFA